MNLTDFVKGQGNSSALLLLASHFNVAPERLAEVVLHQGLIELHTATDYSEAGNPEGLLKTVESKNRKLEDFLSGAAQQVAEFDTQLTAVQALAIRINAVLNRLLARAEMAEVKALLGRHHLPLE